MRYRILLFLTLAVAFHPAQAVQTWSDEGTVDGLRVYAGDYIYGRLLGTTLACGNGNFRVEQNLRLEEMIFSILLSGQMSGKKVKVLQNDDNCLSNGTSIITGARLIE